MAGKYPAQEFDDIRGVPANLASEMNSLNAVTVVDTRHGLCHDHDRMRVERGVCGEKVFHIESISIPGRAEFETINPFEKAVSRKEAVGVTHFNLAIRRQ